MGTWIPPVPCGGLRNDPVEPAALTHTRMHLLVFNIRTDATDTALGFTTTWLNGLAERCRRVSVITMHSGELLLSNNVSVRSLGGERNLSRVDRVVTFYRAVRDVMAEEPLDACFAHMTPRLAIMFAPIAKRHGIPTLLWYAHGSTSRQLQLAHGVVDRCVTSTPAGFGIPSAKLAVVGQGIDTDAFEPPGILPDQYESTLLSVGRLTARKRLDEVIRALSLLHKRGRSELRLELVGGPITHEDRDVRATLDRVIDALQLRDAVTFHGPVPHTKIHSQYHRGAIFVNLSQTGSLDKAILESMASGCIPVSRNASFATLAERHGMQSLVPSEGHASVADRIETILALAPSEREGLSRRLRDIVVQGHSLHGLLDRIVDHLRELAASRR